MAILGPTQHKLFVANGVYPYFRSTAARYRNFAGRADNIARLVARSGADCATFGEMGYTECAQLAGNLKGWQYDRAQGLGPGLWTQGINSVWSKTSVWNQPERDVNDYNMPSDGQTPPRTFIIPMLTEVADPKVKLFIGAFHETLGNDAGLQYVKKMVDEVGKRTPVILGGDFKRTGDDDDLATMKRAGLVVHERISATPMTCFTKGAVKVSNVEHLEDSTCFDHPYLVVSFTVTTTPDPA